MYCDVIQTVIVYMVMQRTHVYLTVTDQLLNASEQKPNISDGIIYCSAVSLVWAWVEVRYRAG